MGEHEEFMKQMIVGEPYAVLWLASVFILSEAHKIGLLGEDAYKKIVERELQWVRELTDEMGNGCEKEETTTKARKWVKTAGFPEIIVKWLACPECGEESPKEGGADSEQ